MRAIGAERKDSAESRARWPLLSIVVPVRNEEAFVGDVLRQLLAQDYPRDRVEILVCDGRSDDRTREIVAEFAAADARVRVLDNPGLRSGPGRNVGFSAARGDIVLVVDGHVHLPDSSLLRNLVLVLEESGADCAGRAQPLRPLPGNPWSHAIATARSSWLGHGRDSLIYSDRTGIAPALTCGAAYRRDVIERVGPIDERFDACEDLDFNRRVDDLGLRCVHDPRLRIEYFARGSVGALFRQMMRYGAGRALYLDKDWRRTTLSQLVPAALAGTAAAALLSPLVPALTPVALIPIVVYLCLVATAAARASQGVAEAVRVALVFPAIHFGLGLGFLSQAAKLAHDRFLRPALRGIESN